MQTYLKVVVDTNDGDYVTRFAVITEEEIKRLTPLFEAIKNFKPYTEKSKRGSNFTHHHNFPNGECCREDLGEKSPDEYYVDSGLVKEKDLELFMDSFSPYPEYGYHSIESIEVLQVADIKKIV